MAPLNTFSDCKLLSFSSISSNTACTSTVSELEPDPDCKVAPFVNVLS